MLQGMQCVNISLKVGVNYVIIIKKNKKNKSNKEKTGWLNW